MDQCGSDKHQPQMIGYWMTSALVVGTIIGSGIFMLPVALAPLGRNAVAGWLISGVGVLCIAYALARLSRLGGEGIQANIERELGPTTGFLVAWSFWVSNWVSQAAVALAAASAMAFVSPHFAGSDTILIVAIGWLVLLTAVNAIGVRAAGSFSIITVAIKILPLLAVIWLVFDRRASVQQFEPFAPAPVDFSNLAAATALTFFAFTGFEAATAPVGKVRDPERIIPRALVGGVAFVVILYLLAATSIQLLLPANVVANSPAPFADALVTLGPWGHGAATFAALTIAVAAVGCLNCLILGTGEVGYAMALRGDLPTAMAKTRGANTPVAAQTVGSVLSVLLLIANNSDATASLYTFIILISTAAVAVVYLLATLAAWKYSPRAGQKLFLALALLFIAFAVYGIGLIADLWVLVLLAAGLAIRAVTRQLKESA